jgi:hypothetical protein
MPEMIAPAILMMRAYLMSLLWIVDRMVFAGSRVRALAVGSDADYEAEKEILIAPGFKASRTGEAHPPTAAGNEVVCFKIVGP